MGTNIVLGVDIGGTKVAAVLASPLGQILEDLVVPTDLGGDSATVDCILEAIQAVLDSAKLTPTEIAAIGIGAPGPVRPDTGEWFGSTNVVLESPPVPLLAIVKHRFGRPTFIENDVKAGALGEQRFGAGRNLQNIVYLSVGTGIAAGIIIGGELYRGLGWAGEIGHASIVLDGPLCNCGTRGCLEMMASGASIARRGQAALRAGRDTLLASLAGGSPEVVTGRMVIEAARKKDPVAQEIMRETATYLAMGVLMAFRAYDPELLVIAGGVAQAGDVLMTPLREALLSQTTGHAATYLDRLTLTTLGEKAGVLGAVALALQRMALA
jgi:glucokinase